MNAEEKDPRSVVTENTKLPLSKMDATAYGTIDDVLTELQLELLSNHLSNSISHDDRRAEFFEAGKGLFRPEMYDPEMLGDRSGKRRNIVILGAGASANSYLGISTGKQLTKDVEFKYTDKLKQGAGGLDWLQNKYKTLEGQLLKTTDGNAECLSFENYLYLLSEHFLNEKDLRQELDDLTGFRYAPILFNEILAHMMKHRFIDSIINFNFEETMDVSLEDEIPNNDYVHILHDGQCDAFRKAFVGTRLKQPVYVKPHGTTGYHSSLRFTNRHYFDIPTQIEEVLQCLFTGRVPESNKKNSNKKNSTENSGLQRVNLLVFGFAMESLEFLSILDDVISQTGIRYKLYFFDYLNENTPTAYQDHKEKLTRLLRSSKATDRLNLDRDVVLVNVADFGKGGLLNPFSELLSVLYRKCQYSFSPRYSPRSISRHELLAYLFYQRKWSGMEVNLREYPGQGIEKRQEIRREMHAYFDRSGDYFKDRTLFEIAFALARGNGKVSMVDIIDGLAGEYYDRYCEAMEARGLKSKTVSVYELIWDLLGLGAPDGDANAEFLPFPNEINFNLIQGDQILDKIEKRCTRSEVRSRSAFNSMNSILQKIHSNEKERLNKKGKNINDKYDENALPLTLIFMLLTSKHLSNDFLKNFKLCHCMPVNNGKYIEDTDAEEYPLYRELIWKFRKLVKDDYYVLYPRNQNLRNHLWPSLQKENIIDTHLSLALYTNTFLKELNKEKSALFSITEVGSNIEYLHTVAERDKPVNCFLIFCYESCKKLFPADAADWMIRMRNRVLHRLYGQATSDEDQSQTPKGLPLQAEQRLHILYMPFDLHMRHASAILGYDASAKPSPLAGFYIRKLGNSPFINPMYLPVNPDGGWQSQHEQEMLKGIFFKSVCLALCFYLQNKGNEDFKSYSKDPEVLLSLGLTEADWQSHTVWTNQQFKDHMDTFFKAYGEEIVLA